MYSDHPSLPDGLVWLCVCLDTRVCVYSVTIFNWAPRANGHVCICTSLHCLGSQKVLHCTCTVCKLHVHTCTCTALHVLYVNYMLHSTCVHMSMYISCKYSSCRTGNLDPIYMYYTQTIQTCRHNTDTTSDDPCLETCVCR